MKVVTEGLAVKLSKEEAAVLRSIGGLAGFVTDRCSREYGWSFEDQGTVRKVLLDLYYSLSDAGVPVFNDRGRN